MDIATLLEMLTQFKTKTINEVIAMFTNKFTLPTAEFIETNVKMVEIKLTTDKNNAFVALEFKMTNPETNMVTMAFTMAKSDVDVKTKFDEIKTKVATVTSKFDATKDAKFLVDILKAKLGTTTDLKGELQTETYYQPVGYTDSNGNWATKQVPYTRKLLKVTGFTNNDVKKLVELKYNNRYYYSNTKNIKQILSASNVFLEIRFDSDSYISAGIHEELNYYTADILNTVTVYGTVKNNIINLDNFDSEIIGLGTIIFNRNDNKYYGTAFSGIGGNGYIYEIVDESSIPAGTKIIDNTSKDRKDSQGEYFVNDTIILKATSIYSGNSVYFKYDSTSHDGNQYSPTKYSSFNLGYINLEDSCNYNIDIYTNIINGNVITSLSSYGLEYNIHEVLMKQFITTNYNNEYIEYCGGVFIENGSIYEEFIYKNNYYMAYEQYERAHYDEAEANNHKFKDFESSDGKISFKFKEKTTTDCYVIYVFEVKNNDKTYTLKHYVDKYDHEYEEKETIEDGCDIETISVCSHCGKANYSHKYNHNYQIDIEHSYDATATQYGYIKYKCSKCGETYDKYVDPTYDGDEVLYLEELDINNLYNLPADYKYDDAIVVGWYSPYNRYWDYDDLFRRYTIKALIVSLDEKGEVDEIYTDAGNQELQCVGSIYDDRSHKAILENASIWEARVSELNDNSTTQYRLAIVALENSYGTVGYTLVIE